MTINFNIYNCNKMHDYIDYSNYIDNQNIIQCEKILYMIDFILPKISDKQPVEPLPSGLPDYFQDE